MATIKGYTFLLVLMGLVLPSFIILTQEEEAWKVGMLLKKRERVGGACRGACCKTPASSLFRFTLQSCHSGSE
jgi:hypothetical protein